MRRLAYAVAAIVLAAACAHMAPPPGGASRRIAAKVIGTYPESLYALPGFKGDASFQFDEVINEATPSFGRGTGDLERHVLLSPDTNVPRVEWHRDRITVRPKGGWRPNTIYWIELLPGIVDLHNNTTRTSYHLTVVTGDSVSTHTIRGRVINWAGRAAAPQALVIATHLADTLQYRGLADSTGRFSLSPLPPGEYLVEAVIDQNSDHKRSAREAWDTVRVGAAGDSTGEIWVFQRDSLPPKSQSITRTDSTTITITLTNPVDPAWRISADSIRVLLLPDSVSIGAVDGYSKTLFDSLFKPIPKAPPPLLTRADSDANQKRVDDSTNRALDAAAKAAAAARAPNARREDPPLQKRLALGSSIIVRTRGNIVLGSHYFVEVRGVRLAGGTIGAVQGRLDPELPPKMSKADSLRADSTGLAKRRARGDTTTTVRVRPDSTTPPARPDSVRKPR